MSEELTLIEQAIGALQLRDVMLNECNFRRPTAPPESDKIQVQQLTKRNVTYVLGSADTEDRGPIRLLQVFVALGIRVADAADDGNDLTVYFQIEADFMVEYEVTSELSEAAIKAFADVNSVHNVWPFWRQHVFDTVTRARMPHLNVPLFGGGVRVRKQVARQKLGVTAVPAKKSREPKKQKSLPRSKG
ncbi:MAG TPA: hypothetical protein VGM84_12020 [Steroidobacteraceae bacterium]|jgi:preprotein translocase subunit SecB